MMDKTNIGSSFDDFLKEEVLLDEVTAVAVKRVMRSSKRIGNLSLQFVKHYCFSK